MRNRPAILAFATLLAFASPLAAAPAFVQSNSPQPPQPARAPFTGVWRGQIGGLPGVTLVLTDESGSLSGAVLFYFQTRKTVNDPWTAAPGLPEPLFHLRVEHGDSADTLTFQVSHRRAHPPASLSSPPVTFTLTLNPDGTARLANLSERAPGLVLTRSDY
jgi:hypothetical protein